MNIYTCAVLPKEYCINILRDRLDCEVTLVNEYDYCATRFNVAVESMPCWWYDIAKVFALDIATL